MNKLVGLFLLTMVTVTTGPAPAADAAETEDSEFRPMAAPANRDPAVLVPPTEVSESSKETFAEKTPQKRPRLILALGGGAFKSVAQIGVLNCLKDNGIEIDGVVGTSLGAPLAPCTAQA